MKRWLLPMLLLALSIGLAVLALRTFHHRDFNVMFSPSDADVQAWANRAKEDRWVELVTLEVVQGKVSYRVVPRDKIDQHVRNSKNVLVRRWIKSGEATVLAEGLVKSLGYRNARKLAQERVDADSARQAKVAWMAAGSIGALLAAGYCAVAMLRRSRRTRDEPNS